MEVASLSESPLAGRDKSDPGDETQRNFRYQHAYGVILVLAAIRGKKPYHYIWCEHHEDFLAHRSDGLFDAYQVKTATPENGPWTVNCKGFRKSVKRFVTLHQKFPRSLSTFCFVSNINVLDTADLNKMDKSPAVLLRAIKSNSDRIVLTSYAKSAFDTLRKHCECTHSDLLSVLKKLEIIKGPARESFESEISNNHLAGVEICKLWPVSKLNDRRDELIHLFYKASSLASDDPSRHWVCVLSQQPNEPYLLAKQIAVDDVSQILNNGARIPFRLMGASKLSLGDSEKTIPVLEEKLNRGGLSSQVDTIRRYALSAEYHLIELAHSSPEEIESILDQLTIIVKGVCDEAYLKAEDEEKPFGRAMLLDVYSQLREIANNRSAMTYSQEYECLLGIAGLLTGECSVWWSKKFELGASL